MKRTRGRPALEHEEPASAVSIRGNRTYRMALRELARRHNKSIADFVRETIDNAHGQELEPLVIFFEQSGLIEVR